jgi:sulfate transport system permease protein
LLARPINAANAWLVAHPDWQHWLHVDQVQILFAFPALVLATLMVTTPMVALEVLPTLEQLDPTEAQAARTLGATGWQTFRRVVLPAIRWSVLYGIVLCLAKAAGEFGAVSGVSGRLIGETNTLTLHIERSYAEWENTKAFASASLLTALAVVTLLVNVLLSRSQAKRSRT